MRVLGIIPARGGSKGIKGKNLKLFGGKPLIFYSIKVGLDSSKLSDLIVNTENNEIENVAKLLGCKVLKRPEALAQDASNVVDTVIDTINQYRKKNIYFDAVMLLQPTSPLRTAEDIDKAVEILEQREVDAVISMVPVGDKHPARMYKFENGILNSCMPEFETMRRQDLPERLIRNGCIYLVRTTSILKDKTLMPKSKTAYIMDPDWAVNVDTEMDAMLLENLLIKWTKEKG